MYVCMYVYRVGVPVDFMCMYVCMYVYRVGVPVSVRPYMRICVYVYIRTSPCQDRDVVSDFTATPGS